MVIHPNYFKGNPLATLDTIHDYLTLCYVEFDHSCAICRESVKDILESVKTETVAYIYNKGPNEVDWYYRIIAAEEDVLMPIPENLIVNSLQIWHARLV